MNQTEETKLLEQIEKWNDADEFSRCIEAIEAIPEQERGYLLTAIWRLWEIMESMGPTVKWTGISSDTPLSCWSPSAPRVRTIPTGTPGWATPA